MCKEKSKVHFIYKQSRRQSVLLLPDFWDALGELYLACDTIKLDQ